MGIKAINEASNSDALVDGRTGTRDSDNKPDPQGLAQRIEAGDRNAETELVGAYKKSLSFILHKKFWNQPFIDDVMQETFAAVITALRKGKLRDYGALSGFLRQTAINIGYHYLRNNYKHRPDVELDTLPDMPDTATNLYDDIEKDDLLAHVRKMIEELPTERDREVLVRFYYKDEDKTEICKHQNLTPEHFDRVLYRAKQRLKLLLEKQSASLRSMSQLMLFAFSR